MGITDERLLVQVSANYRAGRGIPPKQLRSDWAYPVYHSRVGGARFSLRLDLAKSRSGVAEQ